MADRYLVLSAHDMRSRRKANMHFITEELVKLGPTRFFSLGFSALSRLRRRDPRLGLERVANRVEVVGGVECYLWWTPVHPGNSRRKDLQLFSPAIFEAYKAFVPHIFKEWIRDATVILVESGIGILFIEEISKLNPSAKIIYLASDDLETIQVDPYIRQRFKRYAHYINSARLPSRLLVKSIPPSVPSYYVPHGVDYSLFEAEYNSPFDAGKHAVSVGSMLFDIDFFNLVGEEFPDVTFHVIGPGVDLSKFHPAIKVYGEMAFIDTIPFLKNANFGIAPYRLAKLPYYLADTSMKLMQYGAIGLPAVCPYFVSGSTYKNRFEYFPGDKDSIVEAVKLALLAQHCKSNSSMSWADVVKRILNPERYPNTIIHPL